LFWLQTEALCCRYTKSPEPPIHRRAAKGDF